MIDEQAYCLVWKEAHQKLMVPVLAPEKVQPSISCRIWDLIPVPWKGWRDEHVLPTAPNGTNCVGLFCQGALFLDR